MLGVLEKLVWASAVLVILCLGAWVGFVGLPSTTPALAMNSKKTTEQKLKLTPESKAAMEAQKVGVDVGDDGPKERAGGKRRRPSTVYQIDRNTEERLSNLNDCIVEMKDASSEVSEDGSMKIFDIREGSLLDKVGLKDNDVLERIGGKKLDFGNIPECTTAWQASLESLRAGTPVVVELKRNGQVQHLVIAPDM